MIPLACSFCSGSLPKTVFPRIMKKILVIAREDNTRLMYKEKFGTGDYQVSLTCNKEKALRIINNNKPDLITLEKHSSKLNGIKFIQKPLGSNCMIPVILGPCQVYISKVLGSGPPMPM